MSNYKYITIICESREQVDFVAKMSLGRGFTKHSTDVNSLQKENEELRGLLVEVIECFKNQEGHHEKLEICFDKECIGCSFHRDNKQLLENMEGSNEL